MAPKTIFVTRPGFEPRQTESESVVLPLYYRAESANVRIGSKLKRIIFVNNFLLNKVN